MDGWMDACMDGWIVDYQFFRFEISHHHVFSLYGMVWYLRRYYLYFGYHHHQYVSSTTTSMQVPVVVVPAVVVVVVVSK